MHESLWTKDTKLPAFEALKGEKTTDVLIIGGGLTGLLCAYFLRQAGVENIVVEGDRIASGITKNTTAKITSQHGLIYDKLIKSFGREKAAMYLKANQHALKTYETLCQNIDCDFEKRTAYTYSLLDKDRIEREAEAAGKLGLSAKVVTETELPFPIQGAVAFPDQASFHPLKFISAIVQELTVYENTLIRDITPHEAIADKGKIRAKAIIVATHFPFINKHGGYFLKLYQHRSYVTAFENAPTMEGMYVDEDKKGLSFRAHNSLLLIGGGSHRTGKKGGAWQEIERFAGRYYPEAKPICRWATQDCMSLDGVPYIGRYGKNTPDLYVAAGYNKWGMTSAMVASRILSDMVQGKGNETASVFDPGRSILKPQLLVNGLESTVNLLTPTKRRCPHLGCALKWNSAEHSWDCPCHGSRFEKDGRLIDNPATGNANVE